MITGRLFSLLACLLFSTSLAAQQIAVVSDLNGRYGSTRYHERVEKAVQAIGDIGPAMVISAGDMVAGQKQPKLDEQHLQAMWDAFNQTFADPLGRGGIPFAVTPGNHDGSGFERFALERELFERQWRDRTGGLDLLDGSEWPRRYAARLGSVLLVSFDGTIPGRLSKQEFSFVRSMLEEYRDSASTVIVLSHLPMWPLASGREREILDDPDLLALLHQQGVDLFLSGHHHLFYAGRDAGGMIHLATGALGGNARAFSGNDARQAHSCTLLDIDEAGIPIEARPAPGFLLPIDMAMLPTHIDGPLGRLTRIDLDRQ